MDDFSKFNPELLRILREGNQQKISEYLFENLDTAQSLLSSISRSFKTECNNILDMVLDKIYDEKDFVGAIGLINQGLSLKENDFEVQWFKLRSECNLQLLNYFDAKNDINQAIKNLQDNLPIDYFGLSECYIKLADINILLKNFNEAKTDEHNALEKINLGIQKLLNQEPIDNGELSAYFSSRCLIKERIGDINGANLDRELSESFDKKHKIENPECDDLPF
jgi:hypothetical protein